MFPMKLGMQVFRRYLYLLRDKALQVGLEKDMAGGTVDAVSQPSAQLKITQTRVGQKLSQH